MGRETAGPWITEETLRAFSAGICYDIYRKLGAHPAESEGVEGVHFAVWAPRAVSVCVAGDFNRWSRESHPMKKLGDSGVYELFVPGLKQGDLYKYAVKSEAGETVLKADPYGTYGELRPNNASIVWDADHYDWTDKDWCGRRAEKNRRDGPISIYEVHLGTWMGGKAEESGTEFRGYRELAEGLARYVKEMGYTHVELLPVMEHPLDASWGFQTTGYFAPTSRYGTPADFQYFVDYMHSREIGVILDWVPSHFPKDQAGLARFDGTCVYEHLDVRQGENPRWGTLLFNYGRPQVSNFLIASALSWADRFHADGIRVTSMALMLYLDYDKQPGQWVPNLYGGNENLEAVEFLKHLASVFHKKEEGALLIAEESEMWAQVTGDLKEGALGFDYKWNLGWSSDFLRYMACGSQARSRSYSQVTYSMLYAYSEDFIVGFTHDDADNGAKPLVSRMAGAAEEERQANLRAAYGYWMTHPGRKILFMGQDTGRNMQAYVKALNRLYRTQPALYRLDSHPDGFEWIDCLNSQDNILVFLRKSGLLRETLLVVCNFGAEAHESYWAGVPYAGCWQELLSSDDREFGGGGTVNDHPVVSEPIERDGRPYSVEIRVAPFSTHIFKWREG